MNIVILDGYTLNPGDLSWKALEDLGRCKIYDRTPPELVVERASDYKIVLTNKTILTRDIIEKLPNLKYIGVLATGYNIVDVQAARERNIPVTNVPSYGTQAVAQMVFAHLLNLTQHVRDHAQTVQGGKWTKSIDFCYWDYPLVELEGLTMGLIGFGRIGQAVANLALAFGMKVLVHDVFVKDPLPDNVEFAEIEDVFRRSDVLSLHCPLTQETEKLVDKSHLDLMKKSAFLINTSRGPLIDEQALADALNANRLAGAGLDVLTVEPAQANNPLLSAQNCHITPHIAWATKSARTRLLRTVIDNVKAFLDGSPQNVVN